MTTAAPAPVATRSDRRASARLEPVAAKVPEVTILFWVIKLLTTGAGEALSDYLGEANLAVAGIVGVGGFAFALRRQRRSRAYHAPTYWLAVFMIAVFGTMVADVLHVVLDLPYPVTSTIYAIAVATVLLVWHRREGTLDMHSIVTRRRETYYWWTVLATFALGTALGDLTALTLHLGFGPSIGVYAVLIALPLVAWRLGLNSVAAFWAAYVVTRPLGASVADWLGKPHDRSGLGIGDGIVSIAAMVLIAALVAYATVTRVDVQDGSDRAG